MRMSELAERSGVPVATIKYYAREGLLPPGQATGATQALYDESHLERLRLIRVLREIGQVPVAAVGAVLSAVDDPTSPLPDTIALAHQLSLEVVGEGVETEFQKHFLESHGCDLLQGHLLGRPMPRDEMTRLLQDQRKSEGAAS